MFLGAPDVPDSVAWLLSSPVHQCYPVNRDKTLEVYARTYLEMAKIRE